MNVKDNSPNEILQELNWHKWNKKVMGKNKMYLLVFFRCGFFLRNVSHLLFSIVYDSDDFKYSRKCIND